MRNSKTKIRLFLDLVSEGPAWQALKIRLATPRSPEVRLCVTSVELSPFKGDSLIAERANRGSRPGNSIIDRISLLKTHIFLLFILIAQLASSQDFHFSQYTATPLATNPAYAGTFGGTHRVILNYKDQWQAFGAAYKTYALSYDFVLFKDKWESAQLAGGLFVYKDEAGDTKFSNTNVALTAATLVKLNDHHNLSAGLQGGFAQKAVDFSEATTDNQFDNGTHNSTMSIGETNSFDNQSYGDFTAGLAWLYTKNNSDRFADDQIKASIGVALYHLNKPSQEFYDLNDDRLYSKFSLSGDGYVGIKGTRLGLVPSFLFANQGPTKEILLGSMLRYRIKEGALTKGFPQEAGVSIGGYARMGDAFIPAFSLEIANFVLGISYDLNTSDLKTATNGQGGLEISLKFLNPNPFIRAKSQTLL